MAFWAVLAHHTWRDSDQKTACLVPKGDFGKIPKSKLNGLIIVDNFIPTPWNLA